MRAIEDMAFISSFLALSVLTIGLFFLISRFFRIEKKNYPPGPPGIPIFGSLLSLLFDKREQYEVTNDWTNKYGPLVSFKLFNTRLHVLADIELVKEAFQQNPDISDRMTFTPADAITGKKNTGIAFSNGAEWREQRRVFASVFRKVDTSVISFQEIIGEAAEDLIREIENANGESVDPLHLINISIANVISRIVTGITYEFNNADLKNLIKTTERIFDLMGAGGLASLVPFLSKLPLPAVLELKGEYRKLVDFVKNAISHQSATYNPESQPTNFIECYLNEKAKRTATGNWTELDNLNFEMTLVDTLIAGWETSTTTLVWMLHTMAMNVKDQERVRDEISTVAGDGKRPLYSQHQSLPFTEATIIECMRLRPVVDFHLPHVATRDCKIGGYDIAKGDALTTNLWYLAQSPKLWEKPEEFRPSRFLDSSGSVNTDLEPIPFGYGRRVCPGEQLARMEQFMFLTYILQDFKLRLSDSSSGKVQVSHAFTNRPGQFKIHFIKIR